MFNEKEIKEIEVIEEYNAEIEETVETTEEVVAAGKKNLFAEKMNLFGIITTVAVIAMVAVWVAVLAGILFFSMV